MGTLWDDPKRMHRLEQQFEAEMTAADLRSKNECFIEGLALILMRYGRFEQVLEQITAGEGWEATLAAEALAATP